jgi:hypothetical protein
MAVCDLLIGRVESDHVRLEIAAAAADPVAPEWRTHAAIVTVAAGPFSGSIASPLRDHDVQRFITGLRAMYATLAGAAVLQSYESTFALRMTADGTGGIFVTGTARDDPALDRRLHFAFPIDQSYLPALLAAARPLEDA